MGTKRPSFRKPKTPSAYDSPEELFSKLPSRAKTHGYLRGPQADALREYLKRNRDSDIALELPTGTGKTSVGLLIAEWCRRRSGKKVAYLTLTNQLAGQVLDESGKLGLDCADLRGTKDTRDPGEVGRYQTAQAVGITTYSNLFNTNPVIQSSDLLIFDDAHGGEQYVSGMWTVRVGADDEDLYSEAITILRPALTDVQYRVLTDESRSGQVELADVHRHPELVSRLTSFFDEIEQPRIRFPWGLIRNHLDACLVFASTGSVSIRPIVPPTHTHGPFVESRQRIYMSATLGSEGDLRRSYGITDITTARAQHPQWGKRYVFAPALFLEENQTTKVLASVWNEMSTQRALLLVPSFAVGDRMFQKIQSNIFPIPIRLGPQDIEDSLDCFTDGENVILCLAGRYDGLDLPGDDCRLLLMAESPGAIGPLERHQREYWKLGPLLRRRERTRLIQGMGRCTRDATDFAVIILLGQSLLNSITNPDVVQGLPGEIQRELQWGIAQGAEAKDDVETLSEMILGLLCDVGYRKEANENQDELPVPDTLVDSKAFDQGAQNEVKFSRSLWEGNYTRAFEVARSGADDAIQDELAGYRAWWFFLGSIAARARNDESQEMDCLRRARSIGINAGFLDGLLRTRASRTSEVPSGDPSDTQAEAIWNRLEHWGWHGPAFAVRLNEMINGLSSLVSATKYHIGLERLGECLGAESIRPTGQGVPDAVWVFADKAFTLEAKTEKGAETSLSKKEVQQAKGHPDWLRAERPELDNKTISAVVVSSINRIDAAAKPHASGLMHVSADSMAKLGKEVADSLKELRAEFAGKEFAAVLKKFKTRLKECKLHLDLIYEHLSKPLNRS